jgi:hypothetical protein
MSDVARVAGLYRYPVQSVGGEQLEQLSFGPTGVAGDRAFAIADLEQGNVAHASRANRRYHALITWRARYLAAPAAADGMLLVEIDFGDGERLCSDDSAAGRILSERLGMAAALVRNDGHRVPKLYQHAHCHLLTSATLNRLRQHHPEGEFSPLRFRPNIQLDCGEAVGFVEQQWLGRRLRIGSAAFDLDDVCKRCALTTRAQGGLPDDPGILQSVVALNQTIAGIYGSVCLPGTVEVGDPATIIS